MGLVRDSSPGLVDVPDRIVITKGRSVLRSFRVQRSNYIINMEGLLETFWYTSDSRTLSRTYTE